MDTEEVVSAGALAWDLEWAGAWACPLDMDTHIMVTLPIMDTVATTIRILTMDMDTAVTMVTPITEVPIGADITVGTTTGIGMVIMAAADITPKPITATAIWITDNMQGIQDLRGLP